MTGQVYVVGSPGSPTVKIGFSTDPQKRLWSLQVGSPVPLVLLATFEGGRDLESALHRYFASRWKHGEWFELGDAAVEKVRAAVALGIDRLQTSRAICSQSLTTGRLRAPIWDDRFPTLVGQHARAGEPVFHQCQGSACVDCRTVRLAFVADPEFVSHETHWDASPWDERFRALPEAGAATA
ncbi:GIY-YIG nuclease family protein [Streptomyces reticuli]|uniref:GIY-YIG nuclease family protein n=1 Tax=Streptomyces reticuli TaxID=1926 RepID=UPI00073DE9C9|nr:T5orf172 domain protein [Streptomyces reticuli]